MGDPVRRPPRSSRQLEDRAEIQNLSRGGSCLRGNIDHDRHERHHIASLLTKSNTCRFLGRSLEGAILNFRSDLPFVSTVPVGHRFVLCASCTCFRYRNLPRLPFPVRHKASRNTAANRSLPHWPRFPRQFDTNRVLPVTTDSGTRWSRCRVPSRAAYWLFHSLFAHTDTRLANIARFETQHLSWPRMLDSENEPPSDNLFELHHRVPWKRKRLRYTLLSYSDLIPEYQDVEWRSVDTCR